MYKIFYLMSFYRKGNCFGEKLKCRIADTEKEKDRIVEEINSNWRMELESIEKEDEEEGLDGIAFCHCGSPGGLQ